jgi:hypothetical protein
MNMLATQQTFLDHVVDPDSVPDPVFLGKGAAGLEVYRHAYRTRLISSLRAAYDKSWAWMGDERFNEAAAAHITRHIPHSWSLDDYGANFSETLASLFPDDPDIADLAMLEWAMQAAFVKPDSLVADQAALAAFVHSGKDVERLRLWFVASFASFSVSTNCAAIWRAIDDSGEMPPLAHYDTPHIIAIWRTGFNPHFRDIDRPEASAMIAIAEGADFGDICQELLHAGKDESIRATAGAWLGRWIGDGMIARLGS